MNNEEIHRIAEAVADRLQLIPGALNVEEHSNHHRFIEEWIQERRVRRELIESFKKSVGGWLIVTILGGIGYSVWTAFQRGLHQ